LDNVDNIPLFVLADFVTGALPALADGRARCRGVFPSFLIQMHEKRPFSIENHHRKQL
jgi:hypothetical protein